MQKGGSQSNNSFFIIALVHTEVAVSEGLTVLVKGVYKYFETPKVT